MTNNRQLLNHRQFSWLLVSLLTGGGLFSIQHNELIRIGRMDAWFTYLLPLAYVLLVAYVFKQMVVRFPGKHLFEIINTLFGQIAGSLINLVLIVHLWLLLVRDIWNVTKWIGTILLPLTPHEMIVLLFMLLLLFYGRTSIEVLARVTDLYFPIFFMSFLLLPFLLANELQKNLLEPILTTEPLKIGYASFLGLGWYGEVFVMGAFLHTLWSANLVQSAIRHSVLVSTLLLTLGLIIEIIVFGPDLPGNLTYPQYDMVQQIHITDFLDRIDVIMLSIWFPIMACKIIIFYLALLTGISSLIKKRDYTLVNTPVSMLVLLTTILAFKNSADNFSFGNFSSPVIVLSYQPLLFAATLLLMRKQPVKKSIENIANEANGASAGQKQARSPSQPGDAKVNAAKSMQNRLHQVSYRTWVRISDLLIMLSFMLVAAGLIFSKKYAFIGTVCGFGYAILLLLAFVISHLEIKKANQAKMESSHGSSS